MGSCNFFLSSSFFFIFSLFGFMDLSGGGVKFSGKESKIKVQTAIQGEKLRVNGKKRDDLHQVIALLKDSKLDIPLQYENFRD